MVNTQKYQNSIPQFMPSTPTLYPNPKLKVIKEAVSSVSGTLLVTTNSIVGTNIITPQKTVESGSFLEKIWKQPLQHIYNKYDIKDCLILGFGGGSAARIILSLWPDVRITGVELDPLMIKLGKKYLHLSTEGIKIIIDDAYGFVDKNFTNTPRYSLVLVDLFIDGNISPKFESDNFIKKISKFISNDGLIIFNKINTAEKGRSVNLFINKAKKIFNKCESFPYQNNLFILCSN